MRSAFYPLIGKAAWGRTGDVIEVLAVFATIFGLASSLGIGAQLDLVDRQELHLPRQRHGLDGADKILGPGRDDLFLASDEGHAAGPAGLDDAVIDLAGQQP